MTRRFRTPSLDLWRRELADGKRTRTTYDPLQKAACDEASALEQPTPELAESYLERARRIIRDAARGRAA